MHALVGDVWRERVGKFSPCQTDDALCSGGLYGTSMVPSSWYRAACQGTTGGTQGQAGVHQVL